MYRAQDEDPLGGMEQGEIEGGIFFLVYYRTGNFDVVYYSGGVAVAVASAAAKSKGRMAGGTLWWDSMRNWPPQIMAGARCIIWGYAWRCRYRSISSDRQRPTSLIMSVSTWPHRSAMAPPARSARAEMAAAGMPSSGRAAAALRKVAVSWVAETALCVRGVV